MRTRYTPRYTCPRCARQGRTVELDGGSTVYWCQHGHGIPAADVHETHGQVTR